MHQFRCLQIIQRPHIINFKARRPIKTKPSRVQTKANELLSQDVKVGVIYSVAPRVAAKTWATVWPMHWKKQEHVISK